MADTSDRVQALKIDRAVATPVAAARWRLLLPIASRRYISRLCRPLFMNNRLPDVQKRLFDMQVFFILGRIPDPLPRGRRAIGSD